MEPVRLSEMTLTIDGLRPYFCLCDDLAQTRFESAPKREIAQSISVNLGLVSQIDLKHDELVASH